MGRNFITVVFLFFSLSQIHSQNVFDTTLPDLIPYRKGEFWGYCNQQKDLIIPAVYLWAEPFKKGNAWVRLDSTNEAIIDKLGSVIAIARKDTILYISDSGRIYKEYNKKVIAVRESDGFWFTPGKYILKWAVAKDTYLAMHNGRYGLIDRHENIVMPFRYSYISDIDEYGYFLVKRKSGRSGYINLKGEKLMTFKNKRYQLGTFSDGLATVSDRKGKKELYGYINRKGELIIPMTYKTANKFQNGLAEVGGANLKYGFITTKGDTVAAFKYSIPIRYPNGYFSYDLLNGSLLYNADGKQIFKTAYDYIRYVNDTIIIVGKKGPGQLGNYKYGIIDISGNEILPCVNYAIYGSMNDPLIYVAETWKKRYYMDYKLNKYYED